jgi:hypothetical protein
VVAIVFSLRAPATTSSYGTITGSCGVRSSTVSPKQDHSRIEWVGSPDRAARVLRDGRGEAGVQGALDGCGWYGSGLGSNPPPRSAAQFIVKPRRRARVPRDSRSEAGAQGAFGAGGGSARGRSQTGASSSPAGCGSGPPEGCGTAEGKAPREGNGVLCSASLPVVTEVMPRRSWCSEIAA